MSRARTFALTVVLAGLAPLAAHAQQAATPQQLANPSALPLRQANYAWDQDLVRASFSYKDVLADPALLKKLSSGLVMNIVMRAYVYEDGQSTPVALALRACTVSYDLWDEVFRMHISEPEHDRDQAGLLDGVVRNCAEARDLPVVRRGLLTAGKPYFLGVEVDVNPVSKEMLEQMQRWIARPTGNRDIGSGDALFGGFVQLFVRQIGTSDKTITFRTQSKILVP
jgi:hypothetical protein